MVAIPKPASTVVLMDDSFRVYLTKRPKTMKFLGGFYVFPGGKVEKGDSEMDQEQLKKFDLENSLHYSYYVAAARELFEEVGILLVKEENGISFGIEKENEYRHLLIEGELSFIEMLQEEQLHLDLTHLNYLGQIITPESSPVRFDTRFFLAKLPKTQIPNPHPGEIEEASWFHPEEALRNHKKRELQIAPPTIHTLKMLTTYRNGEDLAMPEFNISDYFSQTGGRFSCLPINW